MTKHLIRVLVTAAIVWLVSPASASAISIGLKDDFEDGTTRNWVTNLLGMGAPAFEPINDLGGPAGANDNFLRLRSDGSNAAGGRLVAINPAQWTGDYLGAGIGAIGLDLRNFGTTDVAIRFYLENPIGAPPTDDAITYPFLLPAGSGWTHAVIPLGLGSLNLLNGDIDTLLSNVTVLRLLHSATAAFPPDRIAADIGVDNITALGAVPEPTTILLVGSGIAGLLARRRNTRSS